MNGNELPEAAHPVARVTPPATMATRRVTRASSRLEAARAAGNEGTHPMFSIPEDDRQVGHALEQVKQGKKRRAEGALNEEELQESRFQEMKRLYEISETQRKHMEKRVEESAASLARMTASVRAANEAVRAANEHMDRQSRERQEIHVQLRTMGSSLMRSMEENVARIRSETEVQQRLSGLILHLQDVVELLPVEAMPAMQLALTMAQRPAGPADGQALPAAGVAAAAVPVETAEARKARLDAEKASNDTPESLALVYSRACCVCLCTNPQRRASLVVCGHLVCAVCVELEAGGGTTISCPLCRKRTKFVRIYEDLLSETSEARRQADTGDSLAAADAPGTSAS